MDYIRLTALLFLSGVASSAAQNVVGDCADVYDTGTGYCEVSLDLGSDFQLYSAAFFLLLSSSSSTSRLAVEIASTAMVAPLTKSSTWSSVP